MRSDVLVVAEPRRMPRVECRGGVAARRTDVDTVHLVSAAATPLGGDTICIRVIVEPGARLRLRSAAATVVLPGGLTPTSQSCWHLEIGGHADIDPQPTVVAGQARHHTETELSLADGGRIRLRERVQIGRSGESQGFWSGTLHAESQGTPLLRHRIELGAGSVNDDVLGGPLACISEFRFPETDVDAPGTTLQLAGGGCLTTWQGPRL
jgi:urease accessory protein